MAEYELERNIRSYSTPSPALPPRPPPPLTRWMKIKTYLPINYLSLSMTTLFFCILFIYYLKTNLRTNEELAALNENFEFYKTDMDWKKKLFHEIQNFRNDLKFSILNDRSHLQRRDFAQIEEGARIVEFYGTEYDGYPAWIQSVKMFFGLPSSGACRILSNTLVNHKAFTVAGDKAAFKISLLNKIFIDTIRVEHYVTDFHDPLILGAVPQDIMFYGYQSNVDTPVYLGQLRLMLNSNSKDQFSAVYTNLQQSFDVIKMEVVSNHGNPDFTQIYKLKIYGSVDDHKQRE